jgi:hypothetical protein
MLCYLEQELASSSKHNYVPNEAHPVLHRHATVVGDGADMLCMPEPTNNINTLSYTYRILAFITEAITFYPIAYFQ